MKLIRTKNDWIIKQLSALIDDREALCISDPEHDESYIKDIDALKAAIEFLKNAAPVKHAHWECGCICSECECVNGERGTDYCPHCGARMDGDTNA